MNMMKQIRFSGKLDEKEAFNRITEIKASLQSDRIEINLSGIDSARPLGTVIFANQLRLIINQNPQIEFEFNGYDTNRFGFDYLAQANFFRYLNIARDNKKYHNTDFDIPIPLHDIKRSEIDLRVRESKHKNQKPLKLQQVIQEDCDQMTSMLFGMPEKRISYCFREIIRNTFEHSGATECSVMGQRFDDTNNIEIATIDTGKGILDSLSNNYRVNSIESALKLAIKPGISGADTSGTDEFTNSGFGLYVLSEIGRRFGKFILGTKGKMMLIRNDGKPQFFRSAITGTVVALNIKTAEYLKNRNIVNQIIDDGEAIAAAEGRKVKASASSRISI